MRLDACMDIVHNEANPMRERMEALVRAKQQEITAALSALDNKTFSTDAWERETGGGGVTMTLAEGDTFEKGAVNISIVHGVLPAPAVEKMRANHRNLKAGANGLVNFFACGLSLVIHPNNPHAPTVHANYRYFETEDPETGGAGTWWFGGGADLTPLYLYAEDAVHFHQTIKDALDRHGDMYEPWKKWCDEYFYLKHRKEARGIGGIFFDDYDAKPAGQILAMVEDLFDAFVPLYAPIVARRKDTPFTPEQKKWQLIRRGRYVEFNLVWDRGTQFGLQTPNARIELILVLMPGTACWVYNQEPEEGTPEAELVEVLKSPKEWLRK